MAAVGLGGASPASTLPTSARHPTLILAALAVGSVALALQLTVVVDILPQLQTKFDSDLSAITWVYTSSLLAGAIGYLLLARFGDMRGRRLTLIGVLSAGIVGAVICAVADTLPVMIAGRAIAGFGSAVIPLSIGILRDVLPPERVATGVGVVSATLGIGSGAGIIMAGVIAESTDDVSLIFWVSAALAAVGLVLAVTVVQDRSVPTGGIPDVLGATVFTAAMIALLLAISQGNAWGWQSDRVRYLFVAAVVLLVATGFVERVVRNPLIDLELMAHPGTVTASVVGLLVGFSMFAAFTITSTFAQAPESTGYGFGASTLEVGLYLTPFTAGLLVFGAAAGRLVPRIGSALTTALGSALLAGCYVWLLVDHSAVHDLLGALTLGGAGGGFAFAGLGILTIEHVHPRQTAAASGMNGLFRLVGATISTALVGSVLTSHELPGAPFSSERGFEICFVMCGSGAALGFLVALVVGIRRAAAGRVIEAAPDPEPLSEALEAEQPRTETALPTPRGAEHDVVGPVLSGVVRTVGGQRVPGPMVTIVDSDGCEAGRTRGDDAGRFALELPSPGSYLLIVASPGWCPTAERLLLPAHSVHFEIVLAQAAMPISLAY